MIPTYLRLTNFLSHNNSEIDFTRLDPITLIVGINDNDPSKSNGSGKSSILDGITYALFERSRINADSSTTVDDVVRDGQSKAEVEFHFVIDDHIYRIIRSRDQQKGKSEVTFQSKKLTGKKWNSIAEDIKKETNKKIVQTIGVDYDLFINSVLLAQHEASTFAYKTSGERKDLIANILQLNYYDDYHQRVKEKHDSLRLQLDRVQDYLQQHIGAENSQQDTTAEINTTQESVDRYQGQVDNVIQEIETLRNKQQQEQKIVLNKRNLVEKKESIRRRISEMSTELQASMLSIGRETKQIETLKKSLKEKQDRIIEIKKTRADPNELKRSLDEYEAKSKKYEEAYTSLMVDARSFKDKIQHINEEIKNVVELGEGACPTCYQSVTSESKEEVVKELKSQSQVFEKQFITKKNDLTKITKERDEVNARLEALNQQKQQFNEMNREGKALFDTIKQERERLDGLMTSLQNNEVMKKQYSEGLLKEQQALVVCEEELEKAQDSKLFDQLADQICHKNAMLKTFNETINKLQVQIGRLQEQMKTKQDVMNKVKELREVQTSIDKQIRVQKALMQAFSKKGIQALIMDNVAVELETIVNDLLYKITDGKISVRLLTQKENKDGSLKEVFDVIITDEFHSSPFNLYSGGEKFRIAFAIRVALSMLLARRSGTKISAIFYDEAFNDLDKSGIDKLMEIFQILSKEFKHQLIITHQTELKNKFTDVLTVHKTAEGSKIIQV